MQKITKIFTSLLIFPMLLSAQMTDIKDVTLYLPHAKSKTLVSEKHRIICGKNDDLAEVIFNLLKGKSQAEEYLNLYPENSSARQIGSGATVDIIPGYNAAEPLKAEYLTIYSVVNSLTSTADITTVKFTQHGKSERNFYGFTDMRETFIPDYDICS